MPAEHRPLLGVRQTDTNNRDLEQGVDPSSKAESLSDREVCSCFGCSGLLLLIAVPVLFFYCTSNNKGAYQHDVADKLCPAFDDDDVRVDSFNCASGINWGPNGESGEFDFSRYVCEVAPPILSKCSAISESVYRALCTEVSNSFAYRHACSGFPVDAAAILVGLLIVALPVLACCVRLSCIQSSKPPPVPAAATSLPTVQLGNANDGGINTQLLTH